MMTSPSVPITSVTLVMRREPSRRRSAWTMTSTEPTIISRMVLDGRLKPPMVIMRFETGESFARAVGVERAHRAVMARVHGLQKVERLGSAHFAHDDAFRTHTQTVADEIAHGDLALPFEVGRTGFQAHDMGLLELQFGGVLAGDDALVDVDIGGQTVEQRRLARAGTAGDEDVTARAADHGQHARAFGRDRAVADQILELELVLAELTNGERGTVERQRRRDDVDAGAVGQTRVADRRAFVDAAADLAHDALADVHQLRVVAEADVGELDLAGDFDEHARRRR